MLLFIPTCRLRCFWTSDAHLIRGHLWNWFYGSCRDRRAGSNHPFKYRLALVVDGICVLRYDNEAGKGDHRHVDHEEQAYSFADTDTLLADFWRDVEEWRS
jgi:Family of unknown function (DUF6516)